MRNRDSQLLQSCPLFSRVKRGMSHFTFRDTRSRTLLNHPRPTTAGQLLWLFSSSIVLNKTCTEYALN